MKKLFIVLLVLVNMVFAEEVDRTGPYIAAGGGYAVFNDDDRMGPDPIDPSYNLNFIAGAFINTYLSVELAIDYYKTFTNTANDTTKIYIFDAAAKAHYPLWSDRIDLYAAFGAGGITWKETLNNITQESSSGAVRGDAGVGFRALEWLTFNVGFRRYFFTLDKVDDNGLLTEQYNMELSSAYANIEVQF